MRQEPQFSAYPEIAFFDPDRRSRSVEILDHADGVTCDACGFKFAAALV
jgi:hypothetical protein